MSASGDSGGVLPIIQEARTFPGLFAILFGGIGGLLLAFFQQVIETLRAVFGLFLTPLQVMASVVGRFLLALFGGIARIIGQGAETTIASISPGASFALGPLTFAESIGAAALGLFVVALLISQQITSNVIPGLLVDLPFISLIPGVESPEEEAQETNDEL